MRIAQMVVTPISIGDPPLRNSAGLHAPFALRTIVELISEDGVSGISEIPGSDATTQALRDAAQVVIGRDPYELTGLEQALGDRFSVDSQDRRGLQPWDQRRLVHMLSALEVACLDLIGRSTDRPEAGSAIVWTSRPICSSSTKVMEAHWDSTPTRPPRVFGGVSFVFIRAHFRY